MSSSPQPRRLGRYEVVDLLAQGGMAELFLARLPGIEGFAKRVVVKRVLPNLARDRQFVEMFLEEARLAATLHHQNVVAVHDIGQDDGGYFFAMEYLHGADLGEVLRELSATGRQLPLELALEIARGACAGLHYAHERTGAGGQALGIVHRDVSPQNLFVTFDGSVKLLDFGIAKAAQSIASPYTRTGTLRGKLPYMSPEQCMGEKIDRRSDVFSLGVVIWEITVGQRLFGAHGEADFEVLKQIVERDPPAPSTRSAGYPPALEAIVMKAMRRDRNDRFQNCDQLQAELETFVRSTGRWATARDVAAFLRGLFAERAASSLQIPVQKDEPAQGAVVPFPGTRVAPPPVDEPRPTAPVSQPPSAPVAVAQAPASPPVSRPDVAVASAPAPASTSRLALIIALTAILTAGATTLAVRFLARPSTTPTAPAGTGVTSAAHPAATAKPAEDALWFQADDYLVSEDPYKDGRLKEIYVAKRMTAPDAHGDAEYLTASGESITTHIQWQTHIAAPEELTVGRLAFCRPPHDWDSTAPVPSTKTESRLGEWVAGRVTDIAELSTGHVTVADCRCELGGVRVEDAAAK